MYAWNEEYIHNLWDTIVFLPLSTFILVQTNIGRKQILSTCGTKDVVKKQTKCEV